MWETVRVVAGSARPGRCRDCHQAIVWVVTERGRNLPLDLGFTVRETVTHPATRCQFLLVDRADRHACRARREQHANNRSQTGEK